jgi:hypothetical protein
MLLRGTITEMPFSNLTKTIVWSRRETLFQTNIDSVEYILHGKRFRPQDYTF